MDVHVRTLGILNLVFGVVSAIVSLFLLLSYGGPVELYRSAQDNVIGFLVAGSAIFHLLLAVPAIVGGIHLRSFTEWARTVVIFTSALNILNPPIGSALGCYGLWVLLTPEIEPLFAEPPPGKRRAKDLPTSTQPNAGVPSKTLSKPAATHTIIPSPRS